jgi:SP family general alpha glucoside:H+ symporter-like MFS transporter
MCWGAGILLSSGVIRAVASIEGDLGWRLPFALQWVWPVPLFIVAYLAPESPWNSVRRDKVEEARKNLMRLTGDSPMKAEEVEASLAYIRYTTEMERAETETASFWECFRGTNLRRTEIVSIIVQPKVRNLDSLTARVSQHRTALCGCHKSCAATHSSAMLLYFLKL